MTYRAEVLPILLYHSVDSHASDGFSPWVVPPRRFAAHMAYLADNGYHTLTVRALAAALAEGARQPVPKKTVVVTFDDGFADFHRYALPMLSQHGLAATLYATTGHVGGTSRWLRRVGEGDREMLTWSQLREVASCGVEVGAHSVSHPQLDLLPSAKARAEIVDSRNALQDGLGCAVVTFAYPFGNYDRRVRGFVADAGFSAACAVKHAMSHYRDDRFALARIIVQGDDDVTKLAAYLSGAGLATATSRERIRTTAWRHVRRVRQVARDFGDRETQRYAARSS